MLTEIERQVLDEVVEERLKSFFPEQPVAEWNGSKVYANESVPKNEIWFFDSKGKCTKLTGLKLEEDA